MIIMKIDSTGDQRRENDIVTQDKEGLLHQPMSYGRDGEMQENP